MSNHLWKKVKCHILKFPYANDLKKFLNFCINLVFLLETSLTDEESRKNWEEFGNPDGPQGNNYEWQKCCHFCLLSFEFIKMCNTCSLERHFNLSIYGIYFSLDLKIRLINSLHVKLALVWWEEWKVKIEFTVCFFNFLLEKTESFFFFLILIHHFH